MPPRYFKAVRSGKRTLNMKPNMNSWFFLFVASFLCASAIAAEPEMKRNCRLAGGLFWALDLDNPLGPVLCRFGEAAISAESFSLHLKGESSRALDAYLKSSSGSLCANSNGSPFVSKDSNGREFHLCEFSDGSYIEASTLERGSAHILNEALTKALEKVSGL